MDLSFFQHFTRAITSSSELAEFGWKTAIFRFFDDEWHQGMSGAVDVALLGSLKQVREKKKSLRAGNHQYFYLPSVDAVLVVEIPPRTRDKTVERYQQELTKCVKNTENHFNAHFDKLTRLLNRTGFEEEIKKSFVKRLEESNEEGMLSSSFYATVITFDIDHFKQLNDSYTHQYGDVVLRAFSWRLSDHAERIKERDKLDLTLARMGGEEFDLFIANLKNKDAVHHIAESFRRMIEDEPLPNNAQWASISKDLNLENLKLPNEAERKVTASIGYKVTSIQDGDDPVRKYAELKGKADVALYRAKADGRNCVINYDEIRRKHGRVLRSFSDLEHIVIDIGQAVGVSKGDMFAVRAPQFVGHVAITQNDGRSNKKLGVFPRLTNGRAVVVDVQKEIAFCQVIEKSIGTAFPEGSRLEYIPMGIGSRVESPCTLPILGSVLAPDSFMRELSNAISREVLSMVCVYSIAGNSQQEITSDNQSAVAHLADLVRATLPAGAILGIMRESQIAAFVCGPRHRASDLKVALESAVAISDEKAIITCGYLADEISGTRGVGFQWRNLHADDMLYAATVARSYAGYRWARKISTDRHAQFSPSIAGEIVDISKRAKGTEDAIVDYHRLVQIGVDTTALHNAFGVLVLDDRDFARMDAAEKAFERAAKLSETTHPILSLNLAVAKVFLEHYEEAYELFAKSKTELEKESLYWLYFVGAARCACKLCQTGDRASQEDKHLLDKWMNKALAAAKPEFEFERAWIEDLKRYAPVNN